MRFVKEEIYHIYNKGVEERDVFMDAEDYRRFLKSLKEFNTTKSVVIREISKNPEVRLLGEKRLINILGYILMKNHIHLLVQCIDGKLTSTFLRKLFTGYTNYFNARYRRGGVLFQGRSKSKRIENDAQMDVILKYISLNALDYKFLQWREGKIKNIKTAEKTLLDYPWSGLQEILDRKDYGIIDKELIKDFIPDSKEFLKYLLEWSFRDFEGGINFFMD